MRDISLIISRIKSYLNIKTDSDLAHFLGIKQPTISSWRSRNTLDYDLIITKCNKIDANWLITGKGEMLRSDMVVAASITEQQLDKNNRIVDLTYIIDLQKEKIDRLEKEIADLKSNPNNPTPGYRIQRMANDEEELVK